MSQTFVKKELFRPSADGEHQLYSVLYIPENPRGILQIAHGMAEHIARYDETAAFFASHGWAVCANDHLGHGRSAAGEPGVFSHKEGHGFDYVLADMLSLTEKAKAAIPDVPMVLLGHSMGSILAAIYAEHHGETLDGLILMGTPTPNRAAGAAGFLAKRIRKHKGDAAVSPFLCKLISMGMTAPEKPLLGPNAWLTHNVDNVAAYDKDPLCGFPFTVGAVQALLGGMAEVSRSGWGEKVPKELPCLVIGGAEDTCGGCGKGPKAYSRALVCHGVKNTTLRLVPNARHEVLNETNRAETRDWIYGWLCDHIPGTAE